MVDSDVVVDKSNASRMDVDVVLGSSNIPTIQIITPNSE